MKNDGVMLLIILLFLAVYDATGTFEALNCTITGGCIPGGMIRSAVFDEALIWAIAAPMSLPG